MNKFDMNLATKKLKSLRQQNGWIQQHLADVSGLSLRTIQRAETIGSVSNDTLSALTAVFEVDRSYWQVDSFSKENKQQIIQKGWRIALLSIALAQVISLFLVWLFMGSIYLLWLKSLLAIWLVLGFCYFVVRVTAKLHNLSSIRAFNLLRTNFKKY